jgi:hypothetical protein
MEIQMDDDLSSLYCCNKEESSSLILSFKISIWMEMTKS